METIKSLNEEYQVLFKRERLNLITSMEQEKVEILEALIITNVYWEDLHTDDECYSIKMDLNGQEIEYYSGYEEDDFSFNVNGEIMDFSSDEYFMFRQWWETLKITERIDAIHMERVQNTFDDVVQRRVKAVVEDISIEGKKIVYTLSNGEKIYEDVDRKG